jgi:hypothetical protein
MQQRCSSEIDLDLSLDLPLHSLAMAEVQSRDLS